MMLCYIFRHVSSSEKGHHQQCVNPSLPCCAGHVASLKLFCLSEKINAGKTGKKQCTV